MEKHLINIATSEGTPQQEEKSISTDGYLLLYFEGNRIKSIGDIELSALGPAILKIAVEKFTK